MSDDKTNIWSKYDTQQFAEVLFGIDSVLAMQNFLRDVLTEKEIIEISSRLEVARMLQAGRKYTDIVAKTKLSSRTVARISNWMKNGSGGYATVLNQINIAQDHIPPVRAV